MAGGQKLLELEFDLAELRLVDQTPLSTVKQNVLSLSLLELDTFDTT